MHDPLTFSLTLSRQSKDTCPNVWGLSPKGKNPPEIGRKGKTENWSKTVAKGVVQSLGQMAAINVFHYSIVKPLLFCSWQSFVPSKGNIGIIFPHSLVCFSIF